MQRIRTIPYRAIEGSSLGEKGTDPTQSYDKSLCQQKIQKAK